VQRWSSTEVDETAGRGRQPTRKTSQNNRAGAIYFCTLSGVLGTSGSKSTLSSTIAVDHAISDAIERGRAALTEKWGTEDVTFRDGTFWGAGGFTSSIADVARDFPGVLDGQCQAELRHGSSANGCHACEVEIDPRTGVIRVVRYTAVDDFGRVINENAVRGQVQGGVTMGIGAALMELAPTPDQLAVGDVVYPLPTAMDVPDVQWIDNGLYFDDNVMGAKACAESGSAAAPPTVMNAIADALKDFPAARDLQMPARPADVLRVIRGAI
jgi:aerobic carbon-monoxide dehydrogenase large subunit